MKEQCFLVRKDRRGRGVTVLSRDKTEVSRGGGKRFFLKRDALYKSTFYLLTYLLMQEDASQMSWKNDFEMS